MTAGFIDLNADLGEGGPADDGLLDLVSTASIACGVHAGSPATMVATALLAAARGVSIGAHPSYEDRAGFGRREVDVDAEELYAIVFDQVRAMADAASEAGTVLRHIKPHGALYLKATADPDVAATVVRVAAAAGLALLCPPGSQMQRLARSSQVAAYSEAFADRAYAADGTLVARTRPGAVLHDPDDVAGRAVALALSGRVTAIDGTEIDVVADSICLHGDTPGALDMARAVRRSLAAAGVGIRPFVSQ